VLGVLGRTGSGKTTLTRLLLRLYDPESGVIRLGDTDVRDAPFAALRAAVGLVTQDVQLFGATVRENITLFDDAVPDARVEAALSRLGILDWVAALPRGLDTELAPGGGGMSAGEAQLLAFARILLRDPGLVILDEAASRLDPLTERRLERAIDHLLRGAGAQRTAIVIAHRLSTVQAADDILILEDGAVAEVGPRMALAADPASRFSRLLRAGLEEALA
jgi:ATP-binding cassette subfamily B protein